ncbi:MAG: hypothetical protein COB53_11265 [Elusimicrobia bacterium]|nr:MAG: hypothetical protein COB53_11265 [Elusimicrobiota bacterium]
MNASRRIAAAVLALGITVVGARALEISLEDNKAERGNIGYIDLQKVFKLFPDTHKARQSYREIVNQAEEQINLKKADLFALRAELSKAKLERDLFAKTPIPVLPQPAPAAPEPVVEISTPAVVTATRTFVKPVRVAPVAISTEAAAIPEELLGLPGMSNPLTGENPAPADAPEELIINIPGVTDEPLVVNPPAGETSERAAAIAQKAEEARKNPGTVAPQPVAAPVAATTGAPITADWLAYEAAKLRREEHALKLEAKVAELKAKLEIAEESFAAYQKQVEANLIEIESRRSEILLGKIYKAVRQVARKAGVSVVVDKSQILYGQGSVDLTGEVIKRLEESSR